MNDHILQEAFKLQKLVETANAGYLGLWKNEIIFTWRWWLNVIFTIIPWIVWIFLRKKGSTDRLLYCALFVIIISCWIDFLGTTFAWWYYPINVIPTMPAYIPYDISILPTEFLLFIQFKPRTSPWIKGIILSAFNTFAGEKFLKILHFYQPLNWSWMYSFPLYFIIFLVAYWIVKRSWRFEKIELI
jgi:hypothetical protein